MNTSKSWLAAAVGLALFGAATAAPYPHGPVAALDLGPAGSYADNAKVTVTVALKLRNPDQLEQRIHAIYTQGSSPYRQFMTPEQFSQRIRPLGGHDCERDQAV
jgi:hypothetical protein